MHVLVPHQNLDYIINSDVASRNKTILSSERALVASGSELSYQSLDVQGRMRIDGKVVVGTFQSPGLTEIGKDGILEITSILE